MQHKTRQAFSAVVLSTFISIGALGAACNSATSPVDPPGNADEVSLPKIVWGPAPAVFEPGAEMAVVQGDPSKAGVPFIIRLRMPDGYRIAPHIHPTDEHVTVISGTFKVGMGSTFKEDSMIALPAGGFVTAPAQHAHYARAKGPTIVQVNAIGPFAITYVTNNEAPQLAREK